MQKKNIAVVYGGFSPEYEISVLSGTYVASVIDKNKFNVFEILIKPDIWTEQKTGCEIDKSDFSVTIDGEKIKFDIVVVEIHGTPGENGILQSYFDLLGMPYVSCNSFAASLTFNKFYCNRFLKNSGLKTADSVIVRKNENFRDKLTDFVERTGFPVFVKPNAGGSSFGTFKVKNDKDLMPFVKDAMQYSDEVIVEQFIDGRELTCGVFSVAGEVTALTPVEVRSKNEFFDYEAKYNSALNEEIIPAPVDDEVLSLCKKTSEEIYKMLNCSGIVRIDYILSGDDLYFLELNSIPGMTSESIVPKMLRYEKVDITGLFSMLIDEKLNG